MQFKVPQFLDIEDKIFGPFTFRQFAYLAGGGGLCFVLYKALPFYISFIPILIIAGLALALAFYKVNNKPFIFVVESGIKYLLTDKLYIWKRRMKEKEEEKIQEDKPKIEVNRISRVNTSKLKDLAWSLDVLDIKKNK
jgi:hypothetical protein